MEPEEDFITLSAVAYTIYTQYLHDGLHLTTLESLIRCTDAALPQSALFDFNKLLLVILLMICTSTYIRSLFPSIIDRNKEG